VPTPDAMTGTSTAPPSTADEALRRIVRAYDDRLVRAYCTVRFMILRQRFLFEIGQYLPPSGHVLDVGCGFGLFALYFAMRHPRLSIRGFDMSERRIRTAQRAAARLELRNVEFHVGDAVGCRLEEPISAAYMLDLIHHIPETSVQPLIATISSQLTPGGRLVIKDIEPTVPYKLAFTWLLDKLMDYRAPVRYWAPQEIQPLLEATGFEVHRHRMIDYLPYPHILYIGTRRPPTATG
jgi:2-polyprenyl-3-methyl-5-hydroxy-6-metoxy-1,4-benzoquinol methylase